MLTLDTRLATDAFAVAFANWANRACEVCNRLLAGKPFARAHVVSRDELSRLGVPDELLWDSRYWRWLCQSCHCAFDAHLGQILQTEGRRHIFYCYRWQFDKLLEARTNILREFGVVEALAW